MKNLNQIIVLPRVMAEKGLDESVGPYILISIFDNGFEAVKPLRGEVIDTLPLCFVDWDISRADPEMLSHPMFGKLVGDSLIQPAHAYQLVEFLRKHADAETIVVHCFAGISRSVSTAFAIVDTAGISRSIISIASGRTPWGAPPNQMVYSTMFAALRERLYPKER